MSEASSLTYLALPHNEITNRGAKALLESPHLGRLGELIIYENAGISAAMKKKLQRRFAFVL